jgi:replicative DNA helicase
VVESRFLPHDLDAEEAVNGSLLIDGKAIYEIATFLQPEDFYSPANSSIYRSCLSLYQRDEAIDKITLSQELNRIGQLDKVGNVAYLSHLASIVPTSLEILNYARIVQRLSIMRQLIKASEKIGEIGYSGDVDPVSALNKAEDILFRLRYNRNSVDFVHIRELLEKYFEAPSEQEAGALHPKSSVHSGFTGLDNLLGGFQRSDLIIVAGRPSMGKTSFALNFARNAAVLERACTAIFSLEMSQESLVSRLLSAESGVSAKRIRFGLYQDLHDEFERPIMDAIGVLSEVPILY